jgi:hypothetical protein
MTEESRVLIRHKEDGREFSVTLQDYKRVKHADGQTYAEQGFEVVSWETGEPFKEGQPLEGARKALDQARVAQSKALAEEQERTRKQQQPPSTGAAETSTSGGAAAP